MKKLQRLAAGALALALMLSMSACAKKENNVEGAKEITGAETLAAPSYPEMAAYPNEDEFTKKNGDFDSDGFMEVYDAWREDKQTQQNQPEGYRDGVAEFTAQATPAILSGAGENQVYSPLNVYLALSMLAELTEGDSREQILNLLGKSSVEELRAQAKSLWNANYCSDGALTSVLASSVWLNKDVSFVQSTLDTLAENYYAASFQGEMGSEEMNAALRQWLSQQTGGLLEEAIGGAEFTPETVLGLATTIYYRAKWSQEFSKSKTEPMTFHAPFGDVTCDFMRRYGTGTYYWAENFGAVKLPLRESGSMCLLLPDEGVSPEALLKDAQVMEWILGTDEWENSKFLNVNLALPKFDVQAQRDLKEGLYALGVTDVFDVGAANFAPTCENADGVYLSDAEHAARVTIDEEGVTAAAYTIMMEAGAAMPPADEVDFVLDRPFLFAITARDGMPLFIGVVNNPN